MSVKKVKQPSRSLTDQYIHDVVIVLTAGGIVHCLASRHVHLKKFELFKRQTFKTRSIQTDHWGGLLRPPIRIFAPAFLQRVQIPAGAGIVVCSLTYRLILSRCTSNSQG